MPPPVTPSQTQTASASGAVSLAPHPVVGGRQRPADVTEQLTPQQRAEAGAFLDQILNDAYEKRVTDVHLQAGSPPLWRHNGKIVPYNDRKLDDVYLRAMIRHSMTEHEWYNFAEQTDHDFSYALSESRRYRVNAYETASGVAAVYRVLKSDILDFEKLHLPAVVRTLAESHRGLVMVTGVTGSGKTTTLATMIKYINTLRHWHIITIEDPIEIIHPNINCIVSQREVGRTAESFASAIRYALRQDPDLILVGELRDQESIRTAISAAETGHMVFSTIHAGEAHLVVERMLSFFTGNELEQMRQKLANNLRGVIAQRLLPRKDGRGLVPALEILVGNSGVSRFISEGRIRDLKLVMQNGADGMQTFNMAILKLIKEDLIDVQTGMDASDNPVMLKRMLAGGMSGGDGVGLV